MYRPWETEPEQLTVGNAATGLVDFQRPGQQWLVAGAATSVKFGGDVTLGDGDTATTWPGGDLGQIELRI